MLGDVGAADRSERAADGDETIKAFPLLDGEQVCHEGPEDSGVE